jgi:adenine deaminase
MDERESTTPADAEMGRKPGTLIIRNRTLVNVLSGCLEENTDIILSGNTIALVGDASSHPVGEETE